MLHIFVFSTFFLVLARNQVLSARSIIFFLIILVKLQAWEHARLRSWKSLDFWMHKRFKQVIFLPSLSVWRMLICSKHTKIYMHSKWSFSHWAWGKMDLYAHFSYHCHWFSGQGCNWLWQRNNYCKKSQFSQLGFQGPSGREGRQEGMLIIS